MCAYATAGLDEATSQERRAVARWQPARRWHHPLLATLVIATSRFITNTLNGLAIEGQERFEAVRDRGGRGLLTFSNHVSLFDDPLLPANFAPRRYEEIRWVAADAINFFGTASKAWLFTAGRCVPVVRGAGVGQPGYRFLGERLTEGSWVQIFPEGGRTRDPDALMTGPLKLGIGRLIAETAPLTLPFYHYGMHHVLPVGAKMPRRGHEIRLVFGETVDWTADRLRDAAHRPSGPPLEGQALWEALAGWAYHQLRHLEVEVNPAAARERCPA
jgi:monolysocardiolipin acyltransferase